MASASSTTSFPITEDDVRTALERMLGDERGHEVWREVCDAARIPRPGPELGPEKITRVIEQLKERSGSASVVGNSLSVKIRTHQCR